MDSDSAFFKKKRVLLVVRWPVGGIRTFLRYVYTKFDSTQWHFTILTVSCSDVDSLIEDLKGCDVRFLFVPGMPMDGASGILKFTKHVALELLRSRYDFVHSHGFIAAMCVSSVASFIRVKHVMTSHETLNMHQFLGFKGKLKKWGVGKTLPHIDKVHSVSHDAQENLFNFFPAFKSERNRFVVIPNGINVDMFLNAEPVDLRKECQVENFFLIGFFGRFMSPKGFKYLVEAIGILAKDGTLKRPPLVLAYGGGGFVSREQRNIKEMGLESYFHFLPFESNIAGAIKGVDVVVMPSLWEACGLLAMETLVCGTPLIATDCIGLREVVDGAPILQVPVRDAKALAAAIKQVMVLDSMQEIKDYVEVAAERYDVEKHALAIQQLYEELL